MPSPIALFVYNRPDHTRRTVEALQGNALADQSDLFIYSDAPKNPDAAATVAQVRDYIRSVVGFRSVTVIEREKNWGVDPSVIDGVTTLCDRYGSVIVLEDDLVTTRWFLTFMNEALGRYKQDPRVMQVTGYMFPVDLPDEGRACFLGFISSWGWATWKRAWDHFDPAAAGYDALKQDKRRRRIFDLNGSYSYFAMLEEFIAGKLDAWDIRWYLTVFGREGLILYPQKSLVMNIGFDGSGVHCPPSDFAGSDLSTTRVSHFPDASVDRAIRKRVESYLRSQQSTADGSPIAWTRRRLGSIRAEIAAWIDTATRKDIA